MSTFSLITLILGIVEPILAQSGVIPASYQNLAAGIVNAINALKSELTNATTGAISVTAISLTQAIASGIAGLAASGALPSAFAGLSEALSTAAAAGVAEYEASKAKVDPTTLQPVPTIP